MSFAHRPKTVCNHNYYSLSSCEYGWDLYV